MSGEAWVVLPTYDEAATIERVVHAIRARLAASPEGFRILIVDDNSPDGTGAIAASLARSLPEVRVLHRKHKAGLARAYIAGFDHALACGAGYLIEMDADLSHDPADLPRLLAQVRAGADVVVGSRYIAGGGCRGWSLVRAAVSALGCWYARSALSLPVHDPTSGLRCFRATALRAIGYRSVQSRGFGFQVEIIQRAAAAGHQIVEIPIVFTDRREGRSKMTAGIALEAAWRVSTLALRRRVERPIATRSLGRAAT